MNLKGSFAFGFFFFFHCAPLSPRFSFHWSEAAEDATFHFQNHSQNVCVAVGPVVQFLCFKAIATAPPQSFEMIRLELCEDLQKVRNGPRIERGMCDLFFSVGQTVVHVKWHLINPR
jgi:hypothetical protein